jgi:hypothetical protein
MFDKSSPRRCMAFHLLQTHSGLVRLDVKLNSCPALVQELSLILPDNLCCPCSVTVGKPLLILYVDLLRLPWKCIQRTRDHVFTNNVCTKGFRKSNLCVLQLQTLCNRWMSGAPLASKSIHSTQPIIQLKVCGSC